MLALLATCAAGWGLGAVIRCGLHATWTVGVTGGPHHGEHPFRVDVIPLRVAGSWAARGRASTPRWTCLGLLGVGVVIGFPVMPLRADDEPKRAWAARVAMIALHAGLITIMIRDH